MITCTIVKKCSLPNTDIIFISILYSIVIIYIYYDLVHHIWTDPCTLSRQTFAMHLQTGDCAVSEAEIACAGNYDISNAKVWRQTAERCEKQVPPRREMLPQDVCLRRWSRYQRPKKTEGAFSKKLIAAKAATKSTNVCQHGISKGLCGGLRSLRLCKKEYLI